MTKQVEFYFDVASPTTYLAWTQLPALCERTGAILRYRPMLLGGVFKATGNMPHVSVPAKGRWTLRDLERFANRYGVPIAFNPHFPINTLTLMRAAVAIQVDQPEALERYLRAVFQAIWVEAKDMEKPDVVAAVWHDADFDAQALLAKTQKNVIKQMLKATTEKAVKRGVFGAPSLFVNDELFFGQDRLDFVEDALLYADKLENSVSTA